MNWNILVTVGKEINRDFISSGERKWISLVIIIILNELGIFQSVEGKSPVDINNNESISKVEDNLL